MEAFVLNVRSLGVNMKDTLSHHKSFKSMTQSMTAWQKSMTRTAIKPNEDTDT